MFIVHILNIQNNSWRFCQTWSIVFLNNTNVKLMGLVFSSMLKNIYF
jgi:hypothetical protein